jgi:hypothetical protein
VLDQCLNSGVLERNQNQELQSNAGSDPIKIAEIFRALSDGIFSEVGSLHLDEIGQKIDKLFQQNERKFDDTTLAHLKEIRFGIDRVLKASLNANEP